MMPGLALSLVVSASLGALVLQLLWPRAAAAPASLVLALGTGLGAGLGSVLLFLWMLAFGPGRGFVGMELALLAVVATLFVSRRRTGRTRPPAEAAPGGRHTRLLSLAFILALAAAALAFVSMLRQHPHGEWDAWMNWDLRARMLFRGGEGWRRAFAGTFPWSHPDYPPLVASLVARTWLYAGGETLAGPALVAGTFTFASVALLVSALAALRTTSQGMLAGLVLLATPFFLRHGTALYADVPLAFFFLATLVCLALDARHSGGTGRFAALAGLSAGLSIWTKNEGLLFTLAIAAGLLLTGWGADRRAALRRLGAFGAGLLPLLLMVAVFKVAFAQPNDLLSTLGVHRTLGRITSPDRYVLTLREYLDHLTSFGANRFGSAVWVLTAYFLALGTSRDDAARRATATGAVAVALLLAGHFVVFVSMADELARLLASSLDRLVLQVWPGMLLLYFLSVRALEEASAPPPAVESRR